MRYNIKKSEFLNCVGELYKKIPTPDIIKMYKIPMRFSNVVTVELRYNIGDIDFFSIFGNRRFTSSLMGGILRAEFTLMDDSYE